jgi:hypothetical protein
MMARGSGPARCRRGVVAVVALLIVSGATFAARAAELSVPDHGVGSDVVDRELHGRDTRFQEGTKVWFWTRVVGATEGDLIRHVWMQGGEERLNVELKVDGSPWWRRGTSRDGCWPARHSNARHPMPPAPRAVERQRGARCTPERRLDRPGPSRRPLTKEAEP